MRLKLLASVLLTIVLLGQALPLRADEGMWLPDTIGNRQLLQKMKAKGFALRPEDIFSNTAPSLKDAIVIVDGGTAEFVSDRGLLLTNHHVAFQAIATESTPEKDYLKNGFVSKSETEEIAIKDETYHCKILKESRDVTAEVLAGVTDQMNAEERNTAIETKRREVLKAAQTSKNYECQVVPMLSGLKYYLYVYEIYPDVRLVYAPPLAIGKFGGDIDNFQWPRHTGDFTFLRVYSAPDGSPAEYSPNNVPYRPKKFLPISLNGYKEKDFVMIMGYPGKTSRYLEASALANTAEVQLPFTVKYYTARIELLREAGRNNRQLQLELASLVAGLANTQKNFEGAIRGLKRSNLLARRRAEEIELAKFIDSRPDLKAKYGDVLSKLDNVNEKWRRTIVGNTLVNALASPLSFPAFSTGIFAATFAMDQEKPEAERTMPPALGAGVKKQIPNVFKDRKPEIEQRIYEMLFRFARELPVDQKVDVYENLFRGKTGEDRVQAEKDFAEKIINHPNLSTADGLVRLADMSAKQMRDLNDPVINFLLSAAKEIPEIAKRTEGYNTRVAKLRAEYIEVLTLFRRTDPIYPDANRTLRFTYGEVLGYTPFDGATYRYYTTLKGVVDKDTGAEPFDVPAELKSLVEKRDLGSYADPRFGDVPVAFLATTDITGGNSGSPIMNGRGELIGIAFDGNYEGLGSDYAFNPELARTISVDIRYVLFLVEKMAGATHLLKELKFAGKAAGAR